MAVPDKVKDFLAYITPLINIIPIVLKLQPNLSLKEVTFILFLIGFGFLILTIYLIYHYSKLLVKAVIDNNNTKPNIIKIFITLISTGLIFYFLINRSVTFMNFIVLCMVYFLIIAVTIAITLYLIIKKTNLNDIKKRYHIKTILILTIVSSNVIPFAFAASFSSVNPLVEVSCQPMEILYDNGNQVQSIKNVNVFVKGLEGNARNVYIYIQAPANIYYWVDEIQNDTKTINYLQFDDVNQFLLKIQPSISVGNGTYDIEVHWTYQSDLGINYSNFKVIKIFVGIPPAVPEMPFIFAAIGIVAVIGIVVSLVIIKRRKHAI